MEKKTLFWCTTVLSAFIAFITAFIFCGHDISAQTAKSINWMEAEAEDYNSNEELAARTIYQDWKKISIKKSKPLFFFFYWPVKDKNCSDKDASSQASETEKMLDVLKTDSVVEAVAPFECIKVNLQILQQWGSKGEALAKKYDVKIAPVLVFFDRTGFPQGKISYSTTEATLREKLSFVGNIGSASESASGWVEAEALDFKDEKTLKKRSVFEDWLQTRELGEAKPMIFFFYWPVKDKKNADADKKVIAQAERTESMEKTLADSDVLKQLERFYLFKVNLKELLGYGEEGEFYAAKYKIKSAPVLLVFDYKGKKLISISGKVNSSGLRKKLQQSADKSDKMLKK